ncbi:MAG: DUF547 domain-containing protein [Algibacter sp.]
MKYLQFIFILFLITACSGTKHIVEGTPKTTQETKKVNDSIIDVIQINTEVIERKQTDSLKIDDVVIENTDVTTNKTPITEHDTTLETFNHSSWNTLLKKYVSNTGHVNYKGFKTNRNDLLNYITSLSKNTPTASWSKEEKLAYWINAYNAMTVDLILRHYPVKSIKDIKNPWDQRFWKLGDKWYNLNEIEHDILRKMNEPRIHFGIVCASFSCPKLLNEAFTASNLEDQLTEVTKGFLADSERNIISENNIQISKIFNWFAKDFKQNGSLIDFLNQYSTIKISAKAKKTFKDYNWGLNE